MKGLELSREYYNEFGRPMLEKEFPELLGKIAVGFVGSGSERFGYDDEISTDHDFEPGFAIYLPDENTVDRRTAFLLERAYAHLPKEYNGFRREILTPAGGARNGIIRTSDFYLSKTGTPDGVLTVEEWLHADEALLAEAVNGEVFYDGYGEFTEIRNRLMHRPEDIRRKKIAGYLIMTAQNGIYNVGRCLKHGEREASAMAVYEFVKNAIRLEFCIADRYAPYYKWTFRALRQIYGAEIITDNLSKLLCREASDGEIIDIISETVGLLCAEIEKAGLSAYSGTNPEKHAESVNAGIADAKLRNMHILCAV